MNKKDFYKFNKEEFYKYVKKVGWGYDIIEADADGLWQWIEKYAEEMCKKQKEICAKIYDRDDSHYENFENILYAPLATEKLPGFNEVLGIFKDKK